MFIISKGYKHACAHLYGEQVLHQDLHLVKGDQQLNNKLFSMLLRIVVGLHKCDNEQPKLSCTIAQDQVNARLNKTTG